MIYETMISLPLGCTGNSVHKAIMEVFYNPDEHGPCPRYSLVNGNTVVAYSANPPRLNGKYHAVSGKLDLPEGDVIVRADVAVFRRDAKTGHRKSYTAGIPAGDGEAIRAARAAEKSAALGKVSTKLADFGIVAMASPSWRFIGTVDDPEHRMRLPHGIVSARVSATREQLERLVLSGIGQGRYMGLGSVHITQAE